MVVTGKNYIVLQKLAVRCKYSEIGYLFIPFKNSYSILLAMEFCVDK